MPTLERSASFDATPEELHAWHDRPGAFERMVPPWERVEVVERRGTVADGRLEFELRRGPFRLPWVARMEAVAGGFQDVQERGPFASWVHLHRFREGGVLEDVVEYELPLGGLGRMVAGRAVHRLLERTFDFRHARLARDLAEHRGRATLRVAITGESGLIGSELSALLRSGGHRVDPLVRRLPRAGTTEIRWSATDGEIDAATLEGVDAVVHLAGEPIAGLWTAERKRRIRDSRVQGTAVLARALAGLQRRPQVLLCASAIGWYGDRGQEALDESCEPGQGFLPELCRQWEAAADPAREAGIRVVHLRTGVVLSPRGGALAAMLPAFQLGLGGPVGDGRQAVSWIGLDDLVYACYRLLFEPVEGPVNLTAPAPVPNGELARTLGRVLGRPAVLPAPAPVIGALLGEMGRTLLLEGARVFPRRLEEMGFPFAHPDLEGALRHYLGR